ncbi:MAG: HAMP domain-containing sensor histidine kinase, partial [Eubacteriales bacterium]|nr:HAMP domain-containing sensor histidine kinase [Eubacteriales bacterium]
MENILSFNQLIRRTGIRISWQFLLAVGLLYVFPLLSVSVRLSGPASGFSEAAGAVFLNVFSWMYICLTLILIAGFNIRNLLRTVKREMDTVYQNSLWLAPQPGGVRLMLREFVETNQRIDHMQRRIQAMLEAERKQKEDLIFEVSAASHDLRTPLTVIQGNSELLLYADLSEEHKACLNDIAVASRKINDYFQALIGYAGTFYDDRSEWKPYSIAAVIEALEQEVFYFLEDKSVLTVTNRVRPDRTVVLNLNDLLRAVSNIIRNALEYSAPEHRRIELQVLEQGERFIFSVWNSGSHFSQDLLDHGGRLFYRSNPERNGDPSHYGIGL